MFSKGKITFKGVVEFAFFGRVIFIFPDLIDFCFVLVMAVYLKSKKRNVTPAKQVNVATPLFALFENSWAFTIF